MKYTDVEITSIKLSVIDDALAIAGKHEMEIDRLFGEPASYQRGKKIAASLSLLMDELLDLKDIIAENL
ncbi:hypothetical protein LCGC14_0428240 [marine sediment metagenome]|uniref:Uncharacterized protein n=1 Tax=marine sediment metagenome TaxID=412755 RepID=A0A0F9SUV4_9ZZZZ